MPVAVKSFTRRACIRLPAVLAFALLAFQAAIPWTKVSYVTQDGPSHLYTALIARDLLLNPDSPYAAVYRFQPKLVTNWSTTVLLNVAEILFGVNDAEHAIATFCIVLGFFGISYLRRCVDPQRSPWSPVTNFLLCSWFLWIGFYNFYLGMAIFPFVAGYYIRHSSQMTPRRALAIAASLVLLFFTHVLSLGLALLTIGAVGLWIHCIAPYIRSAHEKPAIHEAIRRLGWLVASMLPSLLLLAIFVKASGQSADYDPSIGWAWRIFPMHAFASGQGRAGEQSLLYPAMLFYMIIGAFSLRGREWMSVRVPLFIVGLLSFCFYLVMPNTGFGGDEIKIRFAWATFIFGCIVASTVARLRPLRVPVALYVTCFLTATLLHTLKYNVRHVSQATAAYAAALEKIPVGATFVRLRFATEATRKRFDFEPVALDPFFHVDALIAAKRKLVALSDYQALSHLFPISYQPKVPEAKQFELWDLEGTGPNGVSSLRELLKDFPVPIDYVVLLGDGSGERAQEYATIRAELEAKMRPFSTDTTKSFVSIYQRIGPR